MLPRHVHKHGGLQSVCMFYLSHTCDKNFGLGSQKSNSDTRLVSDVN